MNSLPSFPRGATAVLLVDPYNDFLSDGGKLAGRPRRWPMPSARSAT